MVTKKQKNSQNNKSETKKMYHFLGKSYGSLSQLFKEMTKAKNYQAAIDCWKQGEIISQVKAQIDTSSNRDIFNEILNLKSLEDDGSYKHVKAQLGLVNALFNPKAGLVVDGNEVTPKNLKQYVDYFFFLKEKSGKNSDSGKKFLMASQMVQVLGKILGNSPLVKKLQSLSDLVSRYSTVWTEYQLLTGKQMEGWEKDFLDMEEARLSGMEWVVNKYMELMKLAKSKNLIPDKAKAVENIVKYQPAKSLGNINRQLHQFKKNYHGAKGEWSLLYNQSEFNPMEVLLLLSAPDDCLYWNRNRQVWRFAGVWLLISLAMIGLIAIPYFKDEVKESENLVYLHWIGSSGQEVVQSVQVALDDGLLIAGKTTGFGKGKNDFWLFKVGKDGKFKWSKTIGGIADDVVNGMALSQDQGFYLGGMTTALGQNSVNSLLVKLDSEGTVVWSQIFDVGGEDEIVGLSEISQENLDRQIAITGRFSQGDGSKMYVAILQSDGKLVWYQRFDQAPDGYGVAVVGGKNQDVIFLGNQQGNNGQRDLVVFAMSLSKELLWKKLYRNVDLKDQKSVLPLSDGILLAGGSLDSNDGSYGVNVMKIDYAGNQLWERRLVDTNTLRPLSLSVIKNGNPGENYLIVTESTRADQTSFNRLYFFSENGDYTPRTLDGEQHPKKSVWGMFEDGKLILIGDDDVGYSRLQDIWVMEAWLSPRDHQ